MNKILSTFIILLLLSCTESTTSELPSENETRLEYSNIRSCSQTTDCKSYTYNCKSYSVNKMYYDDFKLQLESEADEDCIIESCNFSQQDDQTISCPETICLNDTCEYQIQ